jgi:hypothetical protein
VRLCRKLFTPDVGRIARKSVDIYVGGSYDKAFYEQAKGRRGNQDLEPKRRRCVGAKPGAVWSICEKIKVETWVLSLEHIGAYWSILEHVRTVCGMRKKKVGSWMLNPEHAKEESRSMQAKPGACREESGGAGAEPGACERRK